MVTDPLYVKIISEMKPGDLPITAKDAMDRWGYGPSHTRSVINWMTDQQQPPTMQKLSDASPYQWERI